MLLSDDDCLTSVWRICLSVAYIGPKSRTDRPRKTKIGKEIAHVTRHSNTTFKVKRSKVKVISRFTQRGLNAWGEAGAAVAVRTYWAWDSTATLRLLGGARGAGAPTGEERGGAYRVATRTACFFCRDASSRQFRKDLFAKTILHFDLQWHSKQQLIDCSLNCVQPFHKLKKMHQWFFE